MILNDTPDDLENQMLQRKVSANGLIEIGLYPVMFGVRVRAGFVGSHYSHLDWCAGASPEHIQSLYKIAVTILEARSEDRFCFNGIPGVSRVKPYFNDPEFLKEIAKLLEASLPAETPC